MRLRSLVPPLLLALTCARSATADEDAARELFRSGRAAYERGDFLAAAHAFEQAHAEHRTAAALYNAGLSWPAARRLARAAERYEQALAAGDLEPELSEQARRLLAEIEPELGVITVEASGGSVSVGDTTNAPVPARIRVTPGKHELRLRREDGSELVRRVEVRAGDTARVVFESPPPAVAPRIGREPPAARADAPEPATSTQAVLGWTSLGVALAASGAAIYLGTRAVSARDAWVDSGLNDRDDYDRAVALRTWTNVAWAGAGVFGVTGIVLLLTDGGDARPRAGVTIAPDGARASYSGRF